MFNRRAVLALIFVLALAPRIAYLFHAEPARSFSELDKAAESLAADGTLANVFARNSGPTAHVAPVVPLLNGSIYRLFGLDTAWSLRLPAVLSAVATSLAIALLPVLAEAAGLSAGSGLLAALVAVPPLLFPFAETSGVWDVPYTSLLIVIFALVVVRLRQGEWRSRSWVLVLGLLIGTTVLLSPVFVPAQGIVLLGEILQNRPSRRRVIGSLAAAAAIALLVLVPWIARNERVFSKFIPVRSNLGLELAIGNTELSNGETHGPSYRHHPLGSREALNEYRERGEIAYYESKKGEAIDWMGSHKAEFLGLCAKRAYLFWLPPKRLWPSESLMSAAKAIALQSLAVLTVIGTVVLFLVRHPFRWLFLGLALGPSLLFFVTHVELRYRAYVTLFTILISSDLVMRAWSSWLGKGALGWTSRFRLSALSEPHAGTNRTPG